MTRDARQGTPYRADIDGLRAIAVVPVILFHCGVRLVPGGFVGVDIFFVISGYLITAILWREIDGGGLSLAGFYERRVRRIAPALLAVVAVTLAVAYRVMLMSDLRVTARSAVAALFFASNIFFDAQIDYFNDASALMPLLHTWSLAVEEQFYMVFPLALVGLSRWGRPAAWRATLAAAGLSVAACLLLSWRDPPAAFYLPFGRMWELLLGSALALAPQVVRARLARPSAGWLGVAVIGATIFCFDETMPLRGIAMIAPCVGAAMVIASGAGSAAAILGSAPLRAIGLISYSLYLWHWPVLALYRYLFGVSLSAAEIAALIVVIFAVALLSWRFVERPWRRPTMIGSRPRLFAAAAAAAIAIAGGATFAWARAPERFRFPPAAQRAAGGFSDRDWGSRSRCDRPSPERVRADRLCRLGASGGPARFALVSDSIGAALLPAFDRAARARGFRGLALSYSGCPPLFGIARGKAECARFLEAVQARLAGDPAIRHVVLVARWARIVEGRAADDLPVTVFLRDGRTTYASVEENRRALVRSLLRTIDALPGRTVSIVAFVPEQDGSAPRRLAMAALFGWPPPQGLSRAAFEARQHRTRALMTSVAAARRGVTIVDFGAVACDLRVCGLADEVGRPLYRDDIHPSLTGALRWRRAADEALAPLVPPLPRSRPAANNAP